MLFTSSLFLFTFLPATLIVFFFLGRFAPIWTATLWLTLMSFVFYGYWAPRYTVLLVGSVAINYLGGCWINRLRGRPGSKYALALLVTLNLLLLSYFKYYNFFAASLAPILINLPVLNVVLPIGISFFTFTQIAFLVDSYKGKVRDFNVLHYALFVTYFPHLIAGPILHHAEMMPQFAQQDKYRPDLRNLLEGGAFLLIGLFKKVIIADSIAPIADQIFALAGQGAIPLATGWEGTLAYTMQLYYDFSGYSDMAIGISALIGIQLPLNFNSPYKATSIIDFWRRWHMTLSRFLRDYLYIPLGGNRLGGTRRYANLFITMLLGGLWHGAAWTFVIWGALHGLYLALNHAWHWLRARLLPAYRPGPAGHLTGWILTMFAVMIGWVFFRATSVAGAFSMLQSMFGLSSEAPQPTDVVAYPVALASLLFGTAILPNSQTIVGWLMIARRMETLPAIAFSREMRAFAFGVICVLIASAGLIAGSRANTAFIYFNF